LVKYLNLHFGLVFLQAAMGTMHGIINTASASTSMHSYLALLKPKGKMILVGLPEKPLQIPTFSLVGGTLQVFSDAAYTGKHVQTELHTVRLLPISWQNLTVCLCQYVQN
jgi:D-arabinose 1-dehydrogenase-like Zn-dependent alcohol dehydrogenase